jgi:hypothetical protein
MRLGFLLLLFYLSIEFQPMSVEAQTALEQPPTTASPSFEEPSAGRVSPIAGQPPTGHKIPTEKEKLEEFCGKEANQQHAGCAAVKVQ